MLHPSIVLQQMDVAEANMPVLIYATLLPYHRIRQDLKTEIITFRQINLGHRMFLVEHKL